MKMMAGEFFLDGASGGLRSAGPFEMEGLKSLPGRVEGDHGKKNTPDHAWASKHT